MWALTWYYKDATRHTIIGNDSALASVKFTIQLYYPEVKYVLRDLVTGGMIPCSWIKEEEIYPPALGKSDRY
jgi:hypothetical protein